MRRVGVLPGEGLGRACEEHVPARVAAVGAEVDDVVGHLDHVHVVLDDQDCVALLDERPEHGQQVADVFEDLARAIAIPAHVAARQQNPHRLDALVDVDRDLEDAVRREVFEETNIEVGEVQYHSSQPWPFPSSLMLGFNAIARSAEITLNDGELEDARWFTRKELRSGFPKLPYRLSIARRLVDNWLETCA